MKVRTYLTLSESLLKEKISPGPFFFLRELNQTAALFRCHFSFVKRLQNEKHSILNFG